MRIGAKVVCSYCVLMQLIHVYSCCALMLFSHYMPSCCALMLCVHGLPSCCGLILCIHDLPSCCALMSCTQLRTLVAVHFVIAFYQNIKQNEHFTPILWGALGGWVLCELGAGIGRVCGVGHGPVGRWQPRAQRFRPHSRRPPTRAQPRRRRPPGHRAAAEGTAGTTRVCGGAGSQWHCSRDSRQAGVQYLLEHSKSSAHAADSIFNKHFRIFRTFLREFVKLPSSWPWRVGRGPPSSGS